MYKDPENLDGVEQGSLVKTKVFKNRYTTGIGLVLTPQCDLEHKAEFVTIAGVGDAEDVLEKIGVDSRTKLGKKFKGLISGRDLRWYWLHPEDDIKGLQLGGFVDFQLITSLPVAKVLEMPVLGGLEGPWCQQLSARYASYAGRVGTEDTPTETENAWQWALNELFQPARR